MKRSFVICAFFWAFCSINRHYRAGKPFRRSAPGRSAFWALKRAL